MQTIWYQLNFLLTGIFMHRFLSCIVLDITFSFTGSLLAETPAQGSIPLEASPENSGWGISLRDGELCFGLPASTIPGEMNIPILFGFDSACLTGLLGHPEPGPGAHAHQVVQCLKEWPISAGMHFGYLTESLDGGMTAPSLPGAPSVPECAVLEDRKQIPGSQWMSLALNPMLSNALSLLPSFGFTPSVPLSAWVDVHGSLLLFATNLAGLGAPFKRLLPEVAPSGFGSPSENKDDFRILMDKSLTRVYCYAPGARAWLPVIWADRFGHHVTFQWVRSTTDIPPRFRTITKATVMNQQGQGVIVRWAEPGSAALLTDLCRVDFVGIPAPSALIKGYGGGSPPSRPAGVSQPALDGSITPGQTSLGIACRPTILATGSPDALPQPDWADSGSSAAATPVASSEGGPLRPPNRRWCFTYDGALTVSHESNGPRERLEDQQQAQGKQRSLAPGGFWVFTIVCRGHVTFSTTNEAEAQSELERRREHGTESGGTGVRCEIVRTWVSGVGPMGNPSESGVGGPGSGINQTNSQIISFLSKANDFGKNTADCEAINAYLTSIGKTTITMAAFGAASLGETAATIGAMFGFGVGAAPVGGAGAVTGGIIAGLGGLVSSAVPGGIELREKFNRNEENWKANNRAIQNYSNINCTGNKPEIRY
ncbi:MAG: hypothetical protein HGA66_00870 [Holophaga sp.]|nr:hypothetical protein [Holophaga sp.]